MDSSAVVQAPLGAHPRHGLAERLFRAALGVQGLCAVSLGERSGSA